VSCATLNKGIFRSIFNVVGNNRNVSEVKSIASLVHELRACGLLGLDVAQQFHRRLLRVDLCSHPLRLLRRRHYRKETLEISSNNATHIQKLAQLECLPIPVYRANLRSYRLFSLFFFSLSHRDCLIVI
jgi:hypothetical protein